MRWMIWSIPLSESSITRAATGRSEMCVRVCANAGILAAWPIRSVISSDTLISTSSRKRHGISSLC